MKKLISIAIVLCIFIKINTASFTLPFDYFQKGKDFVEKQKRDKTVLCLMVAFGQVESGHNYNAKGASGERGKYQLLKGTWRRYSMKYFGRVVPNTPEYQELLVYNVFSDYVEKGYEPYQIGVIWNAGEGKLKNNAWKTMIGVNKLGVPYDVPAYVNKFVKAYESVCSTTGIFLCSSNHTLYRTSDFS